jgi:hypothetical protein
MKSKFVLLAVCCMLSTAEAQVPWGGESQSSRAGAYALEGLGALGGVACAAGCGGAAYVVAIGAAMMDSPDAASNAMTVAGVCVAGVCAAVLPAASGYGAAKMGENLGEDGSQVWAIGGAYIGVPVGAGLFLLGALLGQRTPGAAVPLYVLGGLAIPVGAVVGYNFGTPSYGGFGGRLELPAMALTGAGLPDHSVEYGVRVQLAGLKF